MKFAELSKQTQHDIVRGDPQTVREYMLQQRVYELESEVNALRPNTHTFGLSDLGPEVPPITLARQPKIFFNQISADMTRPGGGYHFHIKGTGKELSERWVDYYVEEGALLSSLDLSYTMTAVCKEMCNHVIKSWPYSVRA